MAVFLLHQVGPFRTCSYKNGVFLYPHQISTHMYNMYILYTRNAWALPVPIPHQMLFQLCIPLGRSTMVLGNI